MGAYTRVLVAAAGVRCACRGRNQVMTWILNWLRTRWYLWQLLGIAVLVFGFPLLAARDLRRRLRNLFRDT